MFADKFVHDLLEPKFLDVEYYLLRAFVHGQEFFEQQRRARAENLHALELLDCDIGDVAVLANEPFDILVMAEHRYLIGSLPDIGFDNVSLLPTGLDHRFEAVFGIIPRCPSVGYDLDHKSIMRNSRRITNKTF